MLRLAFVEDVVLAYPGPYRLKLLDGPGTHFLPDAVTDGHFNALSGKIMVRPPPRGATPSLARTARRAVPYRLAGRHGRGDIEPAAERTRTGPDRSCLQRWMHATGKPVRMERQIRFAARVADLLPVHALRYPRTVEALDGVAREIRRVVDS